MPLELAYVWDWFCGMSSQRSVSAQGNPLPLSLGRMLEWCQLYAVPPTRYEAQLLAALERAFYRRFDKWMTSQSSASK